MSRQVNTLETYKQRGMRTQGQDMTGHNKVEGIGQAGGEKCSAPVCGCPSRPFSRFVKRSFLAGSPLLSGMRPHSLPTASNYKEVRLYI